MFCFTEGPAAAEENGNQANADTVCECCVFNKWHVHDMEVDFCAIK